MSAESHNQNSSQQVLPTAKSAVRLFTLILGSLLVVLAVATSTLLGSEKGRIWLVQSLVNQFNQTTDLNITIRGLATPALFQWQADSIQVQRHQLNWLEVEQLSLQWQPRALFNQSIVIDRLTADKFSLYQFTPDTLSTSTSTEDASPAKAAPAKTNLRKTQNYLVSNFPNIQVKAFSIAAVDLYGIQPSSIDAKKLSLAISGGITWLKDSPLSIHLDANGLDANPAHLKLKVQSADRMHVTLEGFLQEPAGGIFGEILQLPEEQSIDAGFGLNITVDNHRYAVTAQYIDLPLLQRKLSAHGHLVLSHKNNGLHPEEFDLALTIGDTHHAIVGTLIDQRLQVQLNLNQFPLDIAVLWSDAVNDGELTTQLTITGTTDAPYANGIITANTTYQNIPIAIDFTGSLTRERINIENLSARLAQSELWAKGNLDRQPESSTLNVTLKNFDTKILKQFNVPISDKLNATVTSATAKLNGSLLNFPQHLNGNIDLLAQGDYQQQTFSAQGQLTKRDSTLIAHDLTVTSGSSSTSIKGQLQENILDANITAHQVDTNALKQLNVPVPDKLNATVTSATANIKGSVLDFPNHLNGDLNVLAQGNYQQQPFSIRSQLTKRDNTVDIHDTKITTSEGAISVQGQVQQTSLDADISIKIESISAKLLTLVGLNVPDSLNAQVSSQFRLNGNLRSPHIAGELQLLGIHQAIPFSLTTKGRYQSKNMLLEELNLTAFDEPVLNANGFYKGEQFEFQAHAKKLPSQLLSALDWHVKPGKFSADISGRGTFVDPEINGNLTYQATLSGYNDEGETKDINFSWDVDLSTDNAAFKIKSTFTHSHSAPGELIVTIPKQSYLNYSSGAQQPSKLRPASTKTSRFDGIPLDATIIGHINLQTVSFLFDPDLHRLTGEADANITLNGTLGKPKIDGFIQLDHSRYQNPVTGTLIEDIHCRMNGEQLALKLSDCFATDGAGGNYQLTGTIQAPTNDSTGSVDLNLLTQKVSILQRPDIESEASGNIKLSGNFNALLASGSLELSPLTVVVNSTLSDNIPTIDVEETNLPGRHSLKKSGSPIVLPNIDLDLTLTANNQAYLRGHGLDAELSGQINIQGNLNKPRYDGTVETVRGKFKLFNKSFKLEQGKVSFNNNALNIATTGIYKRNGQRIQADLSGTRNHLQLSLTATPQMAEDEILAYLIFGKSIQKMTPFQAIQLAAAVQSLRGGANGSFDPIGSTRELLRVDTLSIDSASTTEGKDGVNVGIGKYLNERVYLELERTPNPSQPWRGSLEIELTPSINLESSTGGNTGIEGATLKWKRDY